MSSLIYVAGQPGSGKSTLMEELTKGCWRMSMRDGLVRYDVLTAPGAYAVELGVHRDGAFPGTDGLSMAVAPAARQWISARPADLVLAEGDRLASMGFLTTAAEAGYTVKLVWCHPDEVVAMRRRQQRGTKQNDSWVMGRQTKTNRLASAALAAGFQVVDLDTEPPVAEVVAVLRDLVPELRCLP